MQIVLSCEDRVSRAKAAQRQTYAIGQNQNLPINVEPTLLALLKNELFLATKAEILKQELASRFDFQLGLLYTQIDDCNFKFIDTCALKRFLLKCGFLSPQRLLVSIIRRMDLDGDARLCAAEFYDAVQPTFSFTKISLSQLKMRFQDRSSNRAGKENSQVQPKS